MSRIHIRPITAVSAVAAAALILILLPIPERALTAVAVPPPTPTSFRVMTSSTCGGRISLSWSAVTDATSYKIFEGSTLVAVVPAPATSYEVTGLAAGSSHIYAIRASNAAGDSSTAIGGGGGGGGGIVFTRDIVRGQILPEVYDLQVFLNSQGFIVAQTGPGAPGQETTLFGPNTERAMGEFQRSQGLTVTSTLNSETRARINSMRAGSSASTGVAASAACSGAFGTPTGFNAEASPNCGGKITFTWNSVQGATAYKIYEITGQTTLAPSCLNVSGSGLVGYWTFDNIQGNSVLDESGNGNTGTKKNGPLIVPGKIGSALDFDGVDDYVEIPSSASVNSMRNGMTVSAWVKKKRNQSGWGSFIARQWGNSVLDLWNLFYDKSAIDSYCFSVYTTNNPDIPDKCDDILAASSLGDIGTWVYLTGVYDGNKMMLYRNASSIASFSATGQILTNSAPITIGAQYNGGSSPSENVGAVLDELCIYNRALSGSEIRTLYDRSSGSGTVTDIETLVATVSSPSTYFELIGLTPGSSHTYVIRALGSSGESPPSQHEIAIASGYCPAVPPTPINFNAFTSSMCGGHITLSWTAATGATSYKIYEGSTLVAMVNAPATSYEVTGLAPGSSHIYTIRASNSVGDSVASAPNTAISSGACVMPPVTPTNFTATTSTTCGGHITLSWTAAVGATSYKIYEGSTLVAMVNAPATSYEVTGLAPSSSHIYTIRASNSAGDSVVTPARTATASEECLLPPDTPDSPTVNSPSFPAPLCGGRIHVSWTAVPRATSYRLYRDGAASPIFMGSGTTFEDVGLVPGSSHSYRLIASNSAGDSALSPAGSGLASALCPVDLVVTLSASTISGPDPLTGVHLTASVSGTVSGDILYEFDCRNNETIEFRYVSLNTTFTTPAFDTCVYSPTGTYTAFVRVTVGSVTATDTVQITVTDASLTTPGAPRVNVSPFTPLCGGNAVLSWDSVADATGYLVFRSLGATGAFVRITPNPVTSPYTDSGLTPGTTYYYRITALNSVSESPQSDISSGAASPSCGLPNLECRPIPPVANVGQLTVWKVTQLGVDLSSTYTCVWSGSAFGSGPCPFSRILSFTATGTKQAHLNVFSGGAGGTQVGSVDCSALDVRPAGSVIEI